MTRKWPDPPPLFDLDDLEHPGETPSWTPRGALVETAPLAAPAPPEPEPWTQRIAVFDLETTGIDVTSDRIVTAYVGLLDGTGAVVHDEHWLADPGVEIPEGATAVHGITTERARAEGRPASDVVSEIAAALRTLMSGGIPIVAYNAAYDLSLLKHECERHGVEPLASPAPVVDPYVIDKTLDKYRKGKRTLDVVAAHYSVPLDAAHEASADAIAAGRVALALAERYADRLPEDVLELHTRQIGWAREQAESLTEYFVKIGRLEPSEALDGSWPVR
ncbi:3'-5' exonuclease [Microbacterium marinilacus]|uniref:3'-5' exonuclease n=1 Tax=Microbacterium marinilacus TaxID=415209 RepID=A0ABP7BJT2_9MICO|nr:3'-5' exonuclease [Microbacterium marinilacus]MBY0688497.1 3'-5' exonuclease [Microbacterium marinilacus]